MDSAHGSPFKATGSGYLNDIARLAPDSVNATAKLENTALALNDPNRSIYLWIVEVTTGYQLGIETGQGQRGRAHYPRHVQQSDIQIQGITASQFQKDQLVEFISRSQHTVFETSSKGLITPPPTTQLLGHLTFTLYPHIYDTPVPQGQGQQQIIHYEPWNYKVQATNIDAGHERFQFAPTYNLTLLVIDDLLQDNVEVSYELLKRLDKNYKANLFRSNVVDGGTYTRTPAKLPSTITRDAPTFDQIVNETIPSVFGD